ncbi:MAG: RNA 2'-phosphotransferase [Deltaproteobacteria bacterium]|nr:RNA 2'-phosphotransferase [Deltaproteobacteria bacterium]
MRKKIVKTSKFLSLVLRHKPEAVGLSLDFSGWDSVSALLEALAAHGRSVTRDELEEVVRSNDKQRFAIEGERIRANQGHSVAISLGLEPDEPPAMLYHGTAKRFLGSILGKGLQKMGRQHVRLSQGQTTAVKIGQWRLSIQSLLFHLNAPHQCVPTLESIAEDHRVCTWLG